MKKLSLKELVLGCVSCLSAILLLIGIAFSGGFWFGFYKWYNVILSLFNIVIDLAAIALVAANVAFLLQGKTSEEFHRLTVIGSLAIVAAKFVMHLLCNSIASNHFAFPVNDLIAFLLLLVPFIAYTLCKAYIPEAEKDVDEEE